VSEHSALALLRQEPVFLRQIGGSWQVNSLRGPTKTRPTPGFGPGHVPTSCDYHQTVLSPKIGYSHQTTAGSGAFDKNHRNQLKTKL
jgi:hypothetical protein